MLPVAPGAVRVDAGMNTAVDDVVEDVGLQKSGPGVVIAIYRGDAVGQPMCVRDHPTLVPASERRISLLGMRIFDADAVEGAGEPCVLVQLVHSALHPELP
jgi:hypothetical protein